MWIEAINAYSIAYNVQGSIPFTHSIQYQHTCTVVQEAEELSNNFYWFRNR
jgi:hypothetical protein